MSDNEIEIETPELEVNQPDEDIEASEILDSSKSPTGRFSEDIASQVPRWKGVASCDDPDRAIRIMQPFYDAWVDDFTRTNPQVTVVGRGYKGKRQWKQKRDWQGRRSCKGRWITLVVYVDYI